LFTRDLRVHDHPALHAALHDADQIVPLFVLDDRVVSGPYRSTNRLVFLLRSLDDLRTSLRRRGGELFLDHGTTEDVVLEWAERCSADSVFISADVSQFAGDRERRLATRCRAAGLEFRTCPGATVVPPGELTPAGADHYRVFTPYWRSWRSAAWREPVPTPRRIPVPGTPSAGPIPSLSRLSSGPVSKSLPIGGETPGRNTLNAFLRSGLAAYAERRHHLAETGTSRISPYLHFGCLSPLEVATRCLEREDGESFVRQLCWRDFHHQVTAAFGSITVTDYRPRRRRWQDDPESLAAWKQGRTGVPIIDAAMRQLLATGWMHNRARLIAAAFLTRDLHIDWRHGAAHFLHWLVDGDIANNSGNWQWVAGTGNDTRPNRRFNVLRQADRFDPDGQYIRQHVPELANVNGSAVHRPWTLPAEMRRGLGYPAPIVDLDASA
jgi:deoxyribodipyrimidine photo-lyase